MSETTGIMIQRADPHKVGGCNFCHRPHPSRAVYVLRSFDENCTLEARICPICAADLMRELILELA